MEARKSPICPPINLAGIDSASQFFVPVVKYNEQFYFSFLRKQKCPMKQINVIQNIKYLLLDQMLKSNILFPKEQTKDREISEERRRIKGNFNPSEKKSQYRKVKRCDKPHQC